MKNMVRWLVFTAAAALIGVGLAFGLLFLSRLYMGLQQTALVFSILMLYSIGVTIAAISFAGKLEDEAAKAAEQKAAVPRPQSRALATREELDA